MAKRRKNKNLGFLFIIKNFPKHKPNKTNNLMTRNTAIRYSDT